MALSFAIVDAGLYLDGHPQDTAALDYYNEINSAYRAARDGYEAKYGPLSIYDGKETDNEWLWSTTPWPWEV